MDGFCVPTVWSSSLKALVTQQVNDCREVPKTGCCPLRCPCQIACQMACPAWGVWGTPRATRRAPRGTPWRRGAFFFELNLLGKSLNLLECHADGTSYVDILCEENIYNVYYWPLICWFAAWQALPKAEKLPSRRRCHAAMLIILFKPFGVCNCLYDFVCVTWYVTWSSKRAQVFDFNWLCRSLSPSRRRAGQRAQNSAVAEFRCKECDCIHYLIVFFLNK